MFFFFFFVGLGREQLIQLAYLLGCDYTPGINGVGVVMAMEILAEFGKLAPENKVGVCRLSVRVVFFLKKKTAL